ncbi:MAG: UDP-N-acetylglucosamine 2-epimerase, partial [Nitrososphaerota archaeon]|nr:UDP-N-acetylglucosamine 2-epimerase [Nitrososphaerota archaeon]
MKILMALGTRPEIIKLQPVISEALKRKRIGAQLLHTGQHYDWNMSLSFFREFRLRTPDFFLDVKSGTQGAQLSRIISRAEKVLLESEPDFVVVEGDTNSAVGVAIAAAKNGIRVAHVEAGCRSFDRNMQEEINRVLIADLASINFPPTYHCARNLLKEGIPKERILMTGHPIVDILHRFGKESLPLEFRSRLGLRPKKYALVTIHRNENVEDEEKLSSMLEELQKLTLNIKLVFPSLDRNSRGSDSFPNR